MSLIETFEKSRLATGAGELWRRGVTARFLDAVGDGSLPEEAFRRWLVQDYLFVQGFTRFLALAASRTPRPAQSTMIGGLAALDAELAWFEGHAEARGLDLGAAAHPTCRRYVDFLVASAYTKPVEALLAILYGVEVAYTVAWGKLETTGPYAEFIEASVAIPNLYISDADRRWFDKPVPSFRGRMAAGLPTQGTSFRPSPFVLSMSKDVIATTLNRVGNYKPL